MVPVLYPDMVARNGLESTRRPRARSQGFGQVAPEGVPPDATDSTRIHIGHWVARAPLCEPRISPRTHSDEEIIMKRIATGLLVVAAIAALALPALAAPLFTEDFSYALASALNGQGGWSAHSGAGTNPPT